MADKPPFPGTDEFEAWPARDRRTDGQTRNRVAQLVAWWHRSAKHMWLAIAGLYLCTMIAFGWLYYLHEGIQNSRVDNLRHQCEADNAQNLAIRAVLDSSIVTLRKQVARDPTSPGAVEIRQRVDELVQAERAFLVRRDCQTYAEREAALD